MSDTKKPKAKTRPNNLATSQQQAAYTQIISNELNISRARDKERFAKYKDVIDNHEKNNVFAAFKTTDDLFSTVKIGSNLDTIDLSQTRLVQAKEKENARQMRHYAYLESILLNRIDDREVVGKKQRAFDQQRFYNQPLSKDLYRYPLKSSDAYGWRPPVEKYAKTGFELKSIGEPTIRLKKGPAFR